MRTPRCFTFTAALALGLGCNASAARPGADDTSGSGSALDGGAAGDATTGPGSGAAGDATAGPRSGAAGDAAEPGSGAGVQGGGDDASGAQGFPGDDSGYYVTPTFIDAATAHTLVGGFFDASGGPDCTALLACCAMMTSDLQAGCQQAAQLGVDSFCQQSLASFEDAGDCQ